MTDPASYWDRRYAANKRYGSGPGSRGRNARVKAGYVNRFLKAHAVASVVDFGCGDGHVLQLLDLAGVDYLGVDVSHAAVTRSVAVAPQHAYLVWRDWLHATFHVEADCALSVDVLFHFPDDDTYHQYLDRLFGSAARLVLIHSTDRDGAPTDHVRHRTVTADIAGRHPGWRLADTAAGVNGCTWLTYEHP